mmetsp:Transcript_16673/g.54726  ORF Transcript_16673/g.54726 Transcript_16673/m.54726 type:complete len:258 (-) Transcript_16673:432-1205(-)
MAKTSRWCGTRRGKSTARTATFSTQTTTTGSRPCSARWSTALATGSPPSFGTCSRWTRGGRHSSRARSTRRGGSTTRGTETTRTATAACPSLPSGATRYSSTRWCPTGGSTSGRCTAVASRAARRPRSGAPTSGSGTTRSGQATSQRRRRGAGSRRGGRRPLAAPTRRSTARLGRRAASAIRTAASWRGRAAPRAASAEAGASAVEYATQPLVCVCGGRGPTAPQNPPVWDFAQSLDSEKLADPCGERCGRRRLAPT